MMKTGLLGLLFFVMLGMSAAQVPGRGECPDIQVQPNFKKEKYVGTWYEYERFFAAFELGGICGQANYTAKPDGHIRVLNIGFNEWTKKVTSAEGDAYAPDPSVPAKLVVSFPGVPGPFAKGNYWVVSTDYDSYAVVWSCSAIDLKIIDLHGAIAWILTRKRGVLDEDRKTKIYDIFKSYDIDPSYFKKVEQDNCPN
ncbi:apolipoprotein D-like [Liolophura sinensis]|uniref:apolipoprotein D-like n=1 Tax=Liolophura sinensis TaxID=3198878 RepID=UPI00315973D8